ncbi:protein-methionine-sulfoxide reductase catalytic subunit MsrP [Hahella aquimaris]|uniref:protein-methionine-sulfoxide reductase catalytic subunit MsrP n=1 Tax=Hahella sp. HNIBRBA332 TaxID=3015983 RepID=UPI00273B86D8|nr:protein-methionine-sulfoxide reductase catalytic subunit MsrP [Hahella sp. HNIBRBA332]WLQ14073.1 protein-methionine-sulfoxide reductase catalytic subunit MsrP [Hahella sp. HNIBRBA332]
MLIKTSTDIPSSEITDEKVYLSRRSFMRGVAVAAVSSSAAGSLIGCTSSASAAVTPSRQAWEKLVAPQFQNIKTGPFSTSEEQTPYEDILRYNNFYEFGTDKTDPSRYAEQLDIQPWSIKVDGECGKPGSYQLEDLVKESQLEERVYRLRCVEAWSMVIPWVGIPMATILKKFEPNSNAKYVAFETVVRPEQMPGQRSLFSSIEWPYREGLRIDEAMHPLTLAAVGLYGKILPNQNGAPIRLVTPWKYGFKSIKSIVGIKFMGDEPYTTWNALAPNEYGFYANVNPSVDHPRWSQKSERRLPGGLFGPKRIDTLMFNGYADEVASLYTGLDLRKNY